MNMEYLWSAQEIQQGNSSVIRGLLDDVRHAYGHHLPKVTGTKRYTVVSESALSNGLGAAGNAGASNLSASMSFARVR